MSRVRVWLFTAIVGLALAANLVLLSPHVVQAADDGLNARLASASSGLRAQLELLDARLSPRGLAQSSELLEALRPPDPNAPPTRPDERALRAAVAILSPPPDLLVVANGAGAVLSRRGKPAAALDDPGALGPLRKLLEAGAGKPAFVELDKQLFRATAVRAPGGAGAVLAGALIDDRFAQELKVLLDADVAFFQGPSLAASSLPQGPRRDDLGRWQKSRGAVYGYGRLEVRLPLLGHRLDGALPLGTSGLAVRAALVPLDGGVQAAVTVPAGPALAWFARYQALYLVALGLLFVFGLVWSLLPAGSGSSSASDRPKGGRQTRSAPPPPIEAQEPEVGPIRRRPRSVERGDAAPAGVASLLGADASPAVETAPGKTGPADVPWSPAFEGGARWSPGSTGTPARSNGATTESLDPDVPPPQEAATARDQAGHGDAGGRGDAGGENRAQPHEGSDPVWASAGGESAPRAAGGESAPRAAGGGAGAAGGDFNFRGFEEPAAPPTAAAPWPDERAEEHAEEHAAEDQLATLPGAPKEELLARSRDDRGQAEAPFPGNEPTRIQPISAALLEKLREKDEARPASAEPLLADPASAGHGLGEPASDAAGLGEPASDAAGLGEPASGADPDEGHFKETFDQFLALREQTGEGRGNVSYEKFAARLRKNREDLLAKHGGRGVRFAVYLKEGKAAIKASTTR